MSCGQCEIEQEKKTEECYIRIGTANILVFGCDYHLRELMRIIREKTA
jgi:hypothetical protein